MKRIEIKCTVNSCNNKATKRARLFGIEETQDIFTGQKNIIIIENEVFIQDFCKSCFKILKKNENFIEEIKGSE